MWGDHVQLQITANMYDITTHLLVASGNGNVHTFHPDSRLREFAVLEDVEWVNELWLIYINNNHYDSACVTMHTKNVHDEEEETVEEQENFYKSNDSNNDDVEIVKAAKHSIPLLGKWIAGPSKTASHADDHQALKQKVESKDSESKTEIKLKNEIREQNVTKTSLKSLEEQYTKCKTELHKMQEDKERLKIEVKDLKDVKELTNVMINESRERKRKDVIMMCITSVYPFKNREALKKHSANHKKIQPDNEDGQNCEICQEIMLSNNELRKHIKIKHFVHIMRKIPYSYYIAEMKRISTFDQEY